MPGLETIYALMNNEEDALLLFYLILMQLLTQIQVFPPDMVKYAQSSKMLDTSFYIPIEYLPDDATTEVFDTQTTVADLKGLSESGKRILTGELKKSEILECIFNTYIPSLKMMHGSLEKVPYNSTLDYFGQIISNRQLIEYYRIYLKGEKASNFEKIELKNFEDFMYGYYEMNSEEMKRNSKHM